LISPSSRERFLNAPEISCFRECYKKKFKPKILEQFQLVAIQFIEKSKGLESFCGGAEF
jgi:hypothetical protein